MILLVLIVTSALSISFLCSILEASLLSASVVELSRLADKGDRGAARLLELKEKRIQDAIAAILTYNTIAHTVGAALSGAQAARVFGDTWVGVFSGVLTVLILIITEIIPKTIGTAHSVRLAGFVGRTITLMLLPPMKWILHLTRALTRLFASAGHHSTTTRGDVIAMLKIATRDGALRHEESRVLTNLLKFDTVTVGMVMTPRTVCTMFDESTPVADVLADPASRAFSRVPVFRDTRDHVTGYLLMRELLFAANRGENLDKPVSVHARPMTVIAEKTSVGAALKEFTRQKVHLAVVADEMGMVSGLVSMEDLVETALGIEIVDEFDRAEDMRTLAIELRDRRLAGMKQLREQLASSSAAEPPQPDAPNNAP